MKARTIRLLGLGEHEPTSAQRAQRKYRASAKGRAAAKRYRINRSLRDPNYRASERERCKRWRLANMLLRRVYNRVYMRRYRRERKAA